MHTTLGQLDFRFSSSWMEWDRAECFPFVLEPNVFRLAPKQMEFSQRELSLFDLEIGAKLVARAYILE